MNKYIKPTALILLSALIFFAYTQPQRKSTESVLVNEKELSSMLSTHKKLSAEVSKLQAKHKSFPVEDVKDLEILLPDDVDNIRLVLEIEKRATSLNLVLDDIDFEAPSQTSLNSDEREKFEENSYESFSLSFSVNGRYDNFLKFIKDLERNLRIIDIESISFSSIDNSKDPTNNIYKFNMKVKTYWLTQT